MSFYSGVLNTNQYEVVAISASVDTIPPGTAVKVNALPTGSTTPYSYFQVSKASSTDIVFGVVSENSITDTQFGRVILLNSGLTPILMNEALPKGTQIKVTTSDGKFGQIPTGDTPIAVLAENSSIGQLAWAQILISNDNIIPKRRGGFGQDVSSGLTNGHIAIVSGGAMTIGANPNTAVLPLTLYVNGSVATTGNGSFQLPFKTITEALAVAVANTVIYISSGTYTENLTLPNVDNLTIIGSGKNATIITAVAASSTPTLQWPH